MFTFSSNYVIYLSRESFHEFCGHIAVKMPLQSYIFYLVIGQCFHTCKKVLLEILVFSLTSKRLLLKYIALMYRMLHPINSK